MFMNLLVTQLQNQDPSSPMDTNQMIAQTTQLAMMEKLTDMTTTSQENFSLQMRHRRGGPRRQAGQLHRHGRQHRYRAGAPPSPTPARFRRSPSMARHRARRRLGRRPAAPAPAPTPAPRTQPQHPLPLPPPKPSSKNCTSQLRQASPKGATMLRSLYSGISGLRCPPDHAGRHRQQHRQRQHRRASSPRPCSSRTPSPS